VPVVHYSAGDDSKTACGHGGKGIRSSIPEEVTCKTCLKSVAASARTAATPLRILPRFDTAIDVDKRIDLSCPGCGKGFHQTLGWLIERSQITCPGCGLAFDVKIKDRQDLPPNGPQPPPKHSFFTKIAGVSHRNSNRTSRQAIIGRCHVGEDLQLVREPDNSFDSNAIKVLRSNGEQLGYIPASNAASGLSRQLDRGDAIRCRISDLTGGNGWTRGVNIEVGDWDDTPRAGVEPDGSSAFGRWAILFVLAAFATLIYLAVSQSK
jgi:hypothetical protein